MLLQQARFFATRCKSNVSSWSRWLEYKVIADTLASVAAFVAIVSVMVSWYRNARRPLKITRAVIHSKEREKTFILVIKNVKPYPVTINRTECYRKKKYEIQKKLGGRPEYSALFPRSEQLFVSGQTFEIAANGHTDIRFSASVDSDIPKKLLFLLETSHGYHQLWCKDITTVEIEKVDVYSVEYRLDYSTKCRAKAIYYWKFLKGLITSCSRRLRRG